LVRGIRFARPITETALLIALVAWGIYGIATVSTSPSPSSGEGLVGNVLQRIGTSMTINATTSGSNNSSFFIMIFQANPKYDPSTGGPQSYAISFLPSEPYSPFTSFERRYAVFTFSISGGGGFTWGLTGGPGSDGTSFPPTYGRSSFTYSSNQAISPALLIAEASAPGNYTLWVNSSGIATVRVGMGYSSVTFVPSLQFFYFGVVSLIIASGYFTGKVLSFLKKRRGRQPEPRYERIREPIPIGVPLD